MSALYLSTTDNVIDDLVTSYGYAEIDAGNAVDVFTRAAEGDKKAQKILDETAEALAILCINICRILDPEFIIIGGGMSQAGDTLLSLINCYFQKKSWTILDDTVRIILAKNASNSGIIGSALYASSCYYNRTKKREDDLMYSDALQCNHVDDFDGDTNYDNNAQRFKKKVKSLEVLNYMDSNSSFNYDRSDVSNANFIF